MNLSPTDSCRIFASIVDQLERIESTLGHYRHLSNVRAYVDGRNSSPVSLATAAHAIGISQSQLSRLFQDKIGVSFRTWVTLRRVRVAMELMRDRQMPAYEAAYVSGFAHYRSFARTFKGIAGMAPSRYRRMVERDWMPLSTSD